MRDTEKRTPIVFTEAIRGDDYTGSFRHTYKLYGHDAVTCELSQLRDFLSMVSCGEVSAAEVAELAGALSDEASGVLRDGDTVTISVIDREPEAKSWRSQVL